MTVNLNPTEQKEYKIKIKEIANSMTRKRGEDDHISTICDDMKEKYGIPVSETKAQAKLYYDQSLEKERAKANERFDLHETLFHMNQPAGEE